MPIQRRMVAFERLGDADLSAWSDVPTSVIITMRDRVVPLRRQIRLFETIKDAEAFRVDGDHDAVVANADRFVPTLLRAVHSVLERAAEHPIDHSAAHATAGDL